MREDPPTSHPVVVPSSHEMDDIARAKSSRHDITATRQPYRSHEPPRPSVSMVAGRGAGRYGYASSRVAKSNHASKQAAEGWDEMKIDKKNRSRPCPGGTDLLGHRRERWGRQNQESRPHNKHVPRNKERRKQHRGTRINIPASPEVINR